MVAGRNYPPRIVSLLGRTAALVVLMGANQKAARRITLQLQGEGPVTLLVADCTSAMRLRGMARATGDLDGLAVLPLFLACRAALERAWRCGPDSP
jgi:molecular chaperone Hsp33